VATAQSAIDEKVIQLLLCAEPKQPAAGLPRTHSSVARQPSSATAAATGLAPAKQLLAARNTSFLDAPGDECDAALLRQRAAEVFLRTWPAESLPQLLSSPASTPTRSGSLPLHLAIMHGHSAAVVELILSAAPEAARAYDADGYLATHLVLMWREADKMVPLLALLLHPSLWPPHATPLMHAACNVQGATPLHCLLRPLTEQLQATTVARIQALRAKQKEGGGNQTEQQANSMRALLLAAQLQAARVRMQPFELQRAECSDRFTYSFGLVLSELLRLAPSLAAQADFAGDRPVHAAIEGRMSLPLVKRVLELYPMALLMKNKAGHLPLHTALCLAVAAGSKQQQSAGS
jgi:ankyrin repeat protein